MRFAFMFQSTRPVRGATIAKTFKEDDRPFQSTRPVRGATQCRSPLDDKITVSIHAPRAGRDVNLYRKNINGY